MATNPRGCAGEEMCRRVGRHGAPACRCRCRCAALQLRWARQKRGCPVRDPRRRASSLGSARAVVEAVCEGHGAAAHGALCRRHQKADLPLLAAAGRRQQRQGRQKLLEPDRPGLQATGGTGSGGGGGRGEGVGEGGESRLAGTTDPRRPPGGARLAMRAHAPACRLASAATVAASPAPPSPAPPSPAQPSAPTFASVALLKVRSTWAWVSPAFSRQHSLHSL